MNTPYTPDDYIIDSQDHLGIYVSHKIVANAEQKITFVQINKNGSSHFRYVVGYEYYENDFKSYDTNNKKVKPNVKEEFLSVAIREDFINLVFIREPAERLASSIAHDCAVHVDKQEVDGTLTYFGGERLHPHDPIRLQKLSDLFLEEFSTFDLEEYLLMRQRPGVVIPGPKDSNYHSRIQFNDIVVELLQMPNTFIFHVDDDLSDNLLYFFEKHRPYLYEKIMKDNIQYLEDLNINTDKVSLDEIYEMVKNRKTNTKFSNALSFVYYTILPYLKDPRTQPNKIHSDYQKFYKRDIDMYHSIDPDRYFRRP